MLERIEKLWTGDPRRRVLTVAWFGGFGGFTKADLVRGANVGPDEAAALIDQLKAEGELVEVVLGPAHKLLLHRDLVTELEERILAVLARLHEQFPLMSTHDRQKVQSHLDYVGDDPLVHAAVDRLLTAKQLIGDLRRVGRADFKPKLSGNLRKLKDKLVLDVSEGALSAAGAGELRRRGRRQRGKSQRSVRGLRGGGFSGPGDARHLFARRRRYRDAPPVERAPEARRGLDGGRDP